MATIDPFFSIIIPVYNRESTIQRAINSCLEQEFENFEIIVVDDNSQDTSVAIIESYTDKRIRLVKNSENLERCVSRNVGINLAKAQFLCFLDSDDYFLSDHLTTFYDFITKNNIVNGFMFANSIIEDEKGETAKKDVPTFQKEKKFEYLLKYTPNPARVCVSKNILEIEKFDEKIPGIEDLELWLRVAKNYPVYHIESYTNVYYVHQDSYTLGDKNRYAKELEYFKYIETKVELKDYLPKKSMNRLKSMCHFHLSMIFLESSEKTKFYKHAFRSFLLYPASYNGKTNRIILVNAIYEFPILGAIVKSIHRRIKKTKK